MQSCHLRPLPHSGPSRRPLCTIFSQGERAAPGWYAAPGIPQAGTRACPFWVVSRPAPPTRPPRPGKADELDRELRSPCRVGSGASGLPAGPRPGAGPSYRLGFLLWPVCVRVTEGRETGEDGEPGRGRGREAAARGTESVRRSGGTQGLETVRRVGNSYGQSDRKKR